MRPILLLEDDQSFGYILSEYLEMHQMQTIWAKSAEEALKLLEKHSFQLALLDIMLPGMNGYEFAEKLHRQHPNLPFIFLSAKSLKIDQLKGYKLGAFDYITKPIDEELLVAKIKSLLHLSTKSLGGTKVVQHQIGKYSFFPQEQLLQHKEKTYTLTSREADLLRLLAEHKNRLLPRKDTLQEIWGSTDEFSRKSMDVFISSLRKYLSHDPGISIKNVHGKGFILKCPE